MSTPVILFIGLCIVIGGILLLRLHAFVALILAGLVVAALTPQDRVTRAAQLEGVETGVQLDVDAGLVLTVDSLEPWRDYFVVADVGQNRSLVAAGQLLGEVPLPSGPEKLTDGAEPSSVHKSGRPFLHCYAFELTEQTDSDARLFLLRKSVHENAVKTGKQPSIDRLTSALGAYCAQLAILIVAASIIGRCLLDSGAADRIVRSALSGLGEKRAPAAFVISGFTLSIPVFFDTVFYLMIPLGKALFLRTRKNYLLYVLSIVAGGTMAHSLVPPTPGPLFIAEAFGVPMLSMILGGCLVGLFASSVAMTYAYWINGRVELIPEEFRGEDGDVLVEDDPLTASTASPGIILSLLPIVLPVLMIALGTLVVPTEADAGSDVSGWSVLGVSVSSETAALLKTLSNKNIALIVSAAFAVLMYVYVRRPSRLAFSDAMQHAVTSAGTIILVTAAGGAFGRMMRQTSVAELLQGLPGTSPVALVVAAFFVTMAVRTAQGSSTVAMITAAGIFGGLVSSGAAGVDPLYVALAVGCGSKPIAWMNDSGFWVITRMSGMTEKEGLKYVTPMTALAGAAGLLAVIGGVIFFP